MVSIRKTYILIGFVVILFVGAIGVAFADENDVLTPEEALLALINEARGNPLETAAAMGMDPEQILADFPELENILTDGMQPLAFNENLDEAAYAHTGDMFARGYYSSLSPDGQDYEERINDAGYPAVLSGESLGLILFANFINPEEAARLIFEYMFADELDASRTEKRNILDPCLREVGISIQAGTLSLGNGRWNVYLATCDFGSLMSCAEGELFNLINQARVNPLEMLAAYEMDAEELLDEYPHLETFFSEGVAPLCFNLSLAEAARIHAADMLENGFFSSESLDGRTVEDRLLEAEYSEEDFSADELLWRSCLGKDDDLLNELAESNYDQIRVLMGRVFEGMLDAALKTNVDEANNSLLFGETFEEMGIGMAAGVCTEFESICGDRILLLTMDFGARPEMESEPDTALDTEDLP